MLHLTNQDQARLSGQSRLCSDSSRFVSDVPSCTSTVDCGGRTCRPVQSSVPQPCCSHRTALRFHTRPGVSRADMPKGFRWRKETRRRDPTTSANPHSVETCWDSNRSPQAQTRALWLLRGHLRGLVLLVRVRRDVVRRKSQQLST